MRFMVNNIDISKYVLGCKICGEMNNDSLLLGNTICHQLNLKLDNSSGNITPLLFFPFEIYLDDAKKKGIYYVNEIPEKYTGELNLKLYDNMYKFNSRYDTKLSYPCTILDQINEMSFMSGVVIDVSNLSQEVLLKEVNWYDNTLTMRTLLGWIAELNGSNAMCETDGTVIFRDLAVDTYSTIDVESYYKGEAVDITGVCFDNGLIKLESGDDSGNTLFVSSNNGYIDSYFNLDDIKSKYEGLSFYSVKDVRMISQNNKITDLINYNDEFVFMVMSSEEEYKGGRYSIATVSGEVIMKNNKSIVETVSPETKIKRIQTIVDQNSGKIETVVEENKNIAKTTVTKDSFNVTVKELEDKIAGLTVEVGSILAEVKELNFKTTIAKGEDINTYEVDGVPTLSNYPVITDFYIWSNCSNTLYCSDTFICGINDFKSHAGEVALNIKDNTYYIFDIDKGWLKLSDEEYAKLSNFYSSLKVEKDSITMECTKNNKTGRFILTENGFCCC